jgi:hypothetical protein
VTRAQITSLQSQFSEIASNLQVVRAGLAGDDGARLKTIMTSLQEAGALSTVNLGSVS